MNTIKHIAIFCFVFYIFSCKCEKAELKEPFSIALKHTKIYNYSRTDSVYMESSKFIVYDFIFYNNSDESITLNIDLRGENFIYLPNGRRLQIVLSKKHGKDIYGYKPEHFLKRVINSGEHVQFDMTLDFYPQGSTLLQIIQKNKNLITKIDFYFHGIKINNKPFQYQLKEATGSVLLYLNNEIVHVTNLKKLKERRPIPEPPPPQK